MRKYWQIAIMAWQIRMVYRTNILLELGGNLLTMLISITVWIFAFEYTRGSSFGGYTKPEMIAYLLLSGLITSTLWHTAQGDYVMKMIQGNSSQRHGGNLAQFLVKPYSFTGDYIMSQMSSNAFRFVITALIFIIVLLLTPIPIAEAIQNSRIPYFILLLLPAVLIQYLIFYDAALLAFWLEEGWGMTFLIRVFAEVAAGSFIPLSLFAPFWQRLFNILPFKYIVAVPVDLLLGRIPVGDIVPVFLGSIAWLTGLILLTRLIWKTGVRHYSAVGG